VNISVGDIVVFKTLDDKQYTGIIRHDVTEETTECKIIIRGRTFDKIPVGNIISSKPPEPYRLSQQGPTYSTKITWYGNSATFHGERWEVRQSGGSHGTCWLDIPLWAQGVAAAAGMTMRKVGFGHKTSLRNVAQSIVDKAIETGAYPFDLAPQS